MELNRQILSSMVTIPLSSGSAWSSRNFEFNVDEGFEAKYKRVYEIISTDCEISSGSVELTN